MSRSDDLNKVKTDRSMFLVFAQDAMKEEYDLFGDAPDLPIFIQTMEDLFGFRLSDKEASDMWEGVKSGR